MELAIRIALTASIITALILIAGRFGERIAGLLSGLPLMTAPALLQIGEQRGVVSAAEVALGGVVGGALASLFALAYSAAAGRLSPTATLAFALGCLTAGLAVCGHLPLSLTSAAALAGGCSAVTLCFIGNRSASAGERLSSTRQRVRPVLAIGLCSAVVTTLAAEMHPWVAGLITSMPLIGVVTVVTCHRTKGTLAVPAFLRAYVLGSLVKASFCVTFAICVTGQGVFLALLSAALVGVATVTFMYGLRTALEGFRASGGSLKAIARLVRRFRPQVGAPAVILLCVIVSGCGGGSDTTAAAPAAVAPVITQQPASLSVVAGQAATFTVVATGTVPLSYQWQRNGAPIGGASSASYTLSTANSADSAAVFRAVVSNGAGSTISDDASLSVITSAPVLTITQQPASISVVAGSLASFEVGGACSSGTWQVQWQRLEGSAFEDIADANAASYTVAPAIADSGAQFRTGLSCSGQSLTFSQPASLTVTSPPRSTLAPITLTGLRNQADIKLVGAIVREPSGSFAFIVAATIRRLSADLSTITLVAGSSTDSGSSVDAIGPAARFASPRGIAVDPTGNLHIADIDDSTVRRIATDGTVTTIAGRAHSAGAADGPGAVARFAYPNGIAVGPDGDLYVSDGGNNAIRRVTPAGVVTTYAGSIRNFGYVDSSADAARFLVPQGIAVDSDGTVYVSDAGNGRIRRIRRSGSLAGQVDTLAGGASLTAPIDGIGSSAGFNAPHDMTLAGATLYVRDASGLLRAVDTTSAAVTTLTGRTSPPPTDPSPSYADGPRGVGSIDAIVGGVAATGDGRLLLGDKTSGSLRLVAANGYVTTIATGSAYSDNTFDHHGVGVLSQQPLVFDNTRPALAAAPDGSLVVASAQSIRRVARDGSVTPIAGLVGAAGFTAGSNSEAAFVGITALAIKSDGTIAVFDATGVRLVAPATNTVTTLAGATDPGSVGSVDGTGAAARFFGLTLMAYAQNGDLLAADTLNQAIRRITPAGVVTTFAGVMGQPGSADGGPGTARFQGPYSVAIAPNGTVWVTDHGNAGSALRQVAADGSVHTVATSASTGLSFGTGRLAFDPAGNLFNAGRRALPDRYRDRDGHLVDSVQPERDGFWRGSRHRPGRPAHRDRRQAIGIRVPARQPAGFRSAGARDRALTTAAT